MSLVIIVYLIDTVLGVFTGMKVVIVTSSVFILAIVIVMAIEYSDELKSAYKKYVGAKRLSISLILMFLVFLVPSQSTAYKMLAAYSGERLIKTDQAQEIGSKSYKVLNKIMDDYLSEG